MDSGPGEPLDDAVELEAAIEAVGKAREIALGVLGADVVVGAGERGLDVAQHRVHSATPRYRSRTTITASPCCGCCSGSASSRRASPPTGSRHRWSLGRTGVD